MSTKKRLIGIDLFRILLAVFVFVYHAYLNGCSFGILTKFASKSNLFMIAFFMLSGYVLCFSTANRDELKNSNAYLSYLKKRTLSIMPLYLLVVLLNKIVNYANIGTILPIFIEIIGLQSFFNTSFLGNTTYTSTWFISCILVCYIIFPFLKTIIRKQQKRILVFVYIILTVFLSYSFFISYVFGDVDLYHNVFIRAIEFTMGVIVYFYQARVIGFTQKKFYLMKSSLIFVLYIIVISTINSINLKPYIYETLNETTSTIAFSVMLLTFSHIDINDSKVISFLSDISYSFYLSQVIVYDMCKNIMVEKTLEVTNLVNSNITRVIVFFVDCFLVSIILHELVEKRFIRIKNRS